MKKAYLIQIRATAGKHIFEIMSCVGGKTVMSATNRALELMEDHAKIAAEKAGLGDYEIVYTVTHCHRASEEELRSWRIQ